MTLADLEKAVPALKEYTKNMPEDIRSRCTVRIHRAGSVIHQKDMELECFGIVASGENRVINEFENGNVYMIEGNRAIDFIGEVTILAGMGKTSVTIEAVTDNIVAYISRKDAERWLDYLVRFGQQSGMESADPPKFLVLSRTRQMLQEEMGVNVKTLNRTVRQLKEEGFLGICKGKIAFSKEQYDMAVRWLEEARDK